MIKEVFERKIVDNLDSIIECIGVYFGKEYMNDLQYKSQGVKLALVKGNGVVKVGNDEYYVENEPVCIKEGDLSYIFIPLNLLENENGNVIFTHVLLHALVSDVFKGEYDTFNEVVIDYIADDVAKILQKKQINITLEENPVYRSNTFYSLMFPLVNKFYVENKFDIIKSLMSGEKTKIEEIKEISNAIEKMINSVLENEEKMKKEKSYKRK